MLNKVTAKLPVINSVTFSLIKIFVSDKGSNIAFFIRFKWLGIFMCLYKAILKLKKKSVTSTCPTLQQHQIVKITYS